MFFPFLKVFCACLLVLVSCGFGSRCLAGLVINEFLADPSGSDAGKEFVELINTGSEAYNLRSVELQFANGAVEADWQTRWQMVEDYWLAAGERFLLVDRNWQGAAIANDQVWLGLQNGPDAIRLVQLGEILDLVGYGPLTDPDLMEGEAATLVSGMALARRPDGADTQNNSNDFYSTTATPGQINFNNYDLRIKSFVFEPPTLTHVGENAGLSLVLENTGVQDIPPGNLAVLLVSTEGQVEIVRETLFTGCGTSGLCQLFLGFTSTALGSFQVLLEISLPDGEAPLRIPVSQLQVGAGIVFLSEIMSAPVAHQGEWIEIQSLGEGINLGAFQIRDEEGSWKALPEVYLPSGEFIVVAQDSSALHWWHQSNLLQGVVLDCPATELPESLRQMPSSWPSLNNNPPDDRPYADRVYLSDLQGNILDYVTLPGSDSLPDAEGLSWERMSHHSQSPRWRDWRSCTAPQGGTPGCANSVGDLLLPESALSAEPAVLDAMSGSWVTHIRFVLDAMETNWHVEVYNLWGSLVRDLGGAVNGPGIRDLVWDGRNNQGHHVSMGAYVILLHLGRNSEAFRPVAKTLVVVR